MFVCAITMWVIETRICINTGKQNNLKLIYAEKVVNGINYEKKASVCEALLGLHAFTSCNITSAFHGHRKVKALPGMLKYDSAETFRLLGQDWEVSQELLDELQVISYFLHGYLIQGNLRGTESTITNLARRKLEIIHQIKGNLRVIW